MRSFFEVIKPVVLEKDEFENRHLSISVAFWHSRTIMILTQLPKAFIPRPMTPPTTKKARKIPWRKKSRQQL